MTDPNQDGELSGLKTQPIPTKPSNHRVFQKISADSKYYLGRWVARGAGFEPARPLLTTGLAGLGYVSAPLAGFNLLPD